MQTSEEPRSNQPPNKSPRPRRRIKKRYIALAIIALPFLWIAFLIYSAVTAKPGPPPNTYAKLIELSKTVQPTEGTNAWPIFQQASKVHNSIMPEAIEGWLENESWIEDLQEFDAWRYSSTTPEQDALMRALLAVYEQAGLFDLTAKFAAAPRAVRTDPAPQGPLIFNFVIPEAWTARELTRTLLGRFHAAILDNDHETAHASFEESLAIGRIVASQPILIDYLVSNAVRNLAMSDLRRALIEHEFTELQAQNFIDAIDRQGPLPPIAHGIEGERLSVIDMIHFMHSDDGHGDGILLYSQARNLMNYSGSSSTQNSGFESLLNIAGLVFPGKRETTDAANEFFQAMIEQSRLTATQRASKQAGLDSWIDNLPRTQILLRALIPALSRAVHNSDLIAAHERATRIMLAIEIYQARHGQLPVSLNDLTPDLLPAIPTDPVNDLSFVYKLVPPADRTPEDQRTYLLYSVGTDALDDDGVETRGLNPSARSTNDQADIMFTKLRDPPPSETPEMIETIGNDSGFDSPVSEWNTEPDPAEQPDADDN